MYGAATSVQPLSLCLLPCIKFWYRVAIPKLVVEQSPTLHKEKNFWTRQFLRVWFLSNLRLLRCWCLQIKKPLYKPPQCCRMAQVAQWCWAPNITGTFDANRAFIVNYTTGSSGAIKSHRVVQQDWDGIGSGNSATGSGFDLNAAWSNELFGASLTVQPKSLLFLPCIKI